MFNLFVVLYLLFAESSFRQLIIQGGELEKSGNFREAAAAYDKALGDIPGDQVRLLAMVHELRAKALEGNKNYLQAIQDVQLALIYDKDREGLKPYLTHLQLLAAESVASPEDIERAIKKSFAIQVFDDAEPGTSPSVVAPPVNFDFDKDTLSALGRKHVANLAAALRAMPGEHFRLTGHTDSRGTPAYNEDLSLRRARTVVQALVLSNIDASRLMAEGMGARRPISPGNTEADHTVNRRVEIVAVR